MIQRGELRADGRVADASHKAKQIRQVVGGRSVGGKFILRPAQVKSGTRPRACPSFLHASINSRQERNDEWVRAKEETLLAVTPDQGMPSNPFEVPTATVKFHEDNQIGRVGIRSKRMNLEPV